MKIRKSQIYQLEAPKELKVIDRELSIESGDQVLAESIYSAVSPGTELSAWMGKPPLRPGNIYPRVQGYCNLARVVSIGNQVKNTKIGDWILTHQSHRTEFCISEGEILVSFDNLTDVEAKKVVNTYLYHLGYSSLLKAKFFPGHKVGIIGFGALGYTTAALVAAFGGAPVLITSDPKRVSIFNDPCVSTLSKERARSNDEQDSFDIIINTSDSWDDYLIGLKLLRLGGVCVLLGFPGRGENLPSFNPLDSSYLYDKQLNIKYAGHVCESDCLPIDVRFTLKRNMEYISNMILSNRIETAALNSYVENWKDLEQVYTHLNNRTVPSLGGILKW